MGLCQHGANEWIEVYFRDCVYSYRDLAGFILGMASIGFWLVAQMPQIVSNFRTRSAEALSPYFLAEWLLGDTCNLLGCLLTGSQLPTQTYTAMYFICADVVLVVQYIYYTTLQRRRRRLKALRKRLSQRHSRHHTQDRRDAATYITIGQPEVDVNSVDEVQPPPAAAGGQQKVRFLACCALVLMLQWHGSALLAPTGEAVRWRAQQLRLGGSAPSKSREVIFRRRLLWEQERLAGFWEDGQVSRWARDIGAVLGWASSAFYLGSRCSQIYKNWRRKSAEGLSMAMFGCAIAANITYGMGVLLRTYKSSELMASAPWILGSLGTVSLDLLIFWQARYYREHKQEVQPLLEQE